jgi:3-deoxy-manno-octulosonate cytidylyltransferase (CMP-KDO synthetase)
MTSPTRTVAIIPARFGSQRFPGKPLADILGRPMIQHVYERAKKATLVDAVIVATDDARIEAAVRGFGGTAVMTPADLRSGTDREAFVARSLNDAGIVVNVQGDEPLIAPDMIDEAIRPLCQDPAIVAGTLVRKIESRADLLNPGIPKVALDADGYCLYFSRSVIPFGRDVPEGEWLQHHVYYKHIGLYVFRREFLLRLASMRETPLERAEKLEQLRIIEHGYRIKATVTAYDSLSIDTEADLRKVRQVLERDR